MKMFSHEKHFLRPAFTGLCKTEFKISNHESQPSPPFSCTSIQLALFQVKCKADESLPRKTLKILKLYLALTEVPALDIQKF